MDEVFRALADPTRRELLDALFVADGQTLSALESRCQMTRFGVMKHLRVLEDAGLVRTRRRGREKLHFLNPVPIRLVHDRWVSKFAQPWVAALSDLRSSLEDTVTPERTVTSNDAETADDTIEKIFEIYIRTTPERLWQAITSPADRPKFHFGNWIRSDYAVGSRYEIGNTHAPVLLGEGENLEVDPPRRLVQTLRSLWSDDVRAEGTTRVTYEIEPIGDDSCRLTVTHDQLRPGVNPQIWGGWPMILSGLKSWLETGEVLTTPGSLMFGPS